MVWNLVLNLLWLVLCWVNESTTGRRAGCWAAVDPLTGRPPPQQPAPRRARFSWTALIAAVLAAAALVMAVIALIRPTPAAIPASAPITTTPVSITSAVATSGTHQNQVVVSLSIPANTLAVGTTFAIKAFGVQNATAGDVNFQIHLGPSNSTSDPLVSTDSGESVAANGGIVTDGMLTIRTTGSGGTTIAGILTTVTNGATTSTTTTTQTVDTTANNFLTLSVSTSAGVHTIEVAAISVVKA
jgi:hypothetical protein